MIIIADIVTVENVDKIATTISNNGIENTLIAVLVIILLGCITFFVGTFILILKTNTNTTNKLLTSFEKNQKNERELQLSKFQDITNYLKELTDEMKELNQKYHNTIEQISTMIEKQTDKTCQAIVDDKPQSLRDFDKQSKQIIRAMVYESIDFVLEIISRNSLYENKNSIAREILMRFHLDMQNGANYVDALPFRDDIVKQKLFLRVETFMEVAYDDIVEILDVKEKYDRYGLERAVRSIRDDFVNQVNAIRYVDL